MKIHRSVTAARVSRAVERGMRSLDDPGFCLACGKSAHGVEPDAQRYRCESCGRPAVYGAEEVLMMVA